VQIEVKSPPIRRLATSGRQGPEPAGRGLRFAASRFPAHRVPPVTVPALVRRPGNAPLALDPGAVSRDTAVPPETAASGTAA
jgi:hypothetical protein